MLRLQRSNSKRRTFQECLRFNVFAIGFPLLCLELVGVQRQTWWLVLLLELPGAAIAVFTETLIEHWLIHKLLFKTDSES